MNGNAMGRGRGRMPSMPGPPPGMGGPRRGPGPPMNGGPNGFGRPMPNGYGPPPHRGMGPQQSRRGSMEAADLEEFSHLVLYDDIPEGGEAGYGDGSDLALREREFMLRQRELALREQEMRMRRGPPGPRRGPPPSVRNGGYDDDDEDDGEYMDAGPVQPMIDPDNFDMMSVTSRRNRKAPSARDLRKNPEFGDARRGNGMFNRPSYNRNRSSARIISNLPTDRASIMDDPLLDCSSNRYGTVDRANLGRESRSNSLTSARLDEMQFGGAPMGQSGPYPRRSSQSPGNPYSPAMMGRGTGRPSPPNGYMGHQNGNGRPSPPGGVRQPVPRYPPGQGNTVAPQQVEQHAGVSALNPPKGPMNVRSLTGSASASAGSGDSGASAHIDSENSAHSSQSSLGARAAVGVR